MPKKGCLIINEMKKKYNKSGFTLIEAITSTFIFSILIIIISAVFALFINSQRKAFNIQQVVENSNYILESMAKEIRMASGFVNTFDGCTSADTILGIRHPTNPDPSVINGSIEYSWDQDNGTLHRILKGDDASGNPIQLDTILNTSSVKFTRFKFCKNGLASGDDLQPRITIVATVSSLESSQQATFDIQTTISPRNLLD
jgi:type II secretory pathway pseudopilin PulG